MASLSSHEIASVTLMPICMTALYFSQWLACLSLCEKLSENEVMPGLLFSPWSRFSILFIWSILVLNQLELLFCI